MEEMGALTKLEITIEMEEHSKLVEEIKELVQQIKEIEKEYNCHCTLIQIVPYKA